MLSCMGILSTEIINTYYDTRAVGQMEAQNHRSGCSSNSIQGFRVNCVLIDLG
jgi:hypothetical protein